MFLSRQFSSHQFRIDWIEETVSTVIRVVSKKVGCTKQHVGPGGSGNGQNSSVGMKNPQRKTSTDS
ncbi:hypothetical protein NEUTE1DRAFT_118590 [Neurospora tetrasperma FGSC 2508]|uniref:Uncharacterized protein n=1 Tax=Neurospora tetrasperma (strain FGSC 2508 / ATCC MYA-4615 / P0657) TaxID=510951 RepID=F8MYW0_NEUT8|nr:uncharacterized protein NEUTE1DRAFT_118590 [Neurospora tetrasperma FGSC 2508]EGO51958.1 hypothetical protein NEUTE1DRAFT_118590 [Neurospora tetrasperma FGSC 2508]